VALPGGGTLTVAVLREGEMFGEMALIERGVCTASVVARGPVEAWFVGREDFRAMVASREASALGLQREITRILAARLRALNARLREHPSAEDRPAAPVQESSETRAPGFDWRAFLPILPFFEGFDAEEIDELVAGAQAYEAGRGHMLFRPGEPADHCWLVVRGAVEVFVSDERLQRRIAIAGPGELVGYLAVLERARHGASARVREPACLLPIPAERFLKIYESNSGVAIRLQHAVHKSLLRSLARTNTQLGRLISHARLAASTGEAAELEAALHGQIVQSSSLTET
jgi:CRP-like cAMP-binding protein